MKTSVSCTASRRTLTSSSPCPARSKTAPPAPTTKGMSVLTECVRYGAFLLFWHWQEMCEITGTRFDPSRPHPILQKAFCTILCLSSMLHKIDNATYLDRCFSTLFFIINTNVKLPLSRDWDPAIGQLFNRAGHRQGEDPIEIGMFLIINNSCTSWLWTPFWPPALTILQFSPIFAYLSGPVKIFIYFKNCTNVLNSTL